jgi:hypothetical protein
LEVVPIAFIRTLRLARFVSESPFRADVPLSVSNKSPYIPKQQNNRPGRTRMRWVIALFVALLSIPVAQVAADAWNGRPGPHVSGTAHPPGSGPEIAVTRHQHYRLYDPLAPWIPSHPKTG